MAENKKEFKPSLFSKFGYANPTGEIAQSRLGITYWDGRMKIAIAIKEDGNGDSYTYKDAVAVYLPYTKAMILSKAISMVLHGDLKTGGTTAGNGYIAVSKTDKGEFLLTIIDFSNSTLVTDENTFVYQFKDTHHYIISDMVVQDDGTFNHNKNYLPELEVEMLRLACDQFVNAMTMADAYANIVALQFDARLNKLFPIAAQLGISDFKNGGYRASAAGDIFGSSGNEGAPITSGSILDL